MEIKGLYNDDECWTFWCEWHGLCPYCRLIYDLMMAGF